MSTPIRHLFKSKIKSPLSPRVGYNKATCRYENHLRVNTKSRNFVKSLNFDTISGDLLKGNSAYFKEHSKSGTDSNNNVKVTVTDCSNNVLLLNSPNKNNILKNGLDSFNHIPILGKGSFGTVLSAIYKGNNVAIKVVKLTKNGLYIRENNALKLNHKNIVKVIEVIHDFNANYGIVLMEHLFLSHHLQILLDDDNLKLSQEIITKYAIDICEGLKYCHENKVLHLDLKPSNVLVSQYGICKLCDFGNSVKLCKTSKWNGQHATAAYAAPELLFGDAPTEKCDVYSLGIVLWQMRSREMPYSEIDGIETIIYKVIKFDYRPNSRFVLIYDEYTRIYMKCWEANPLNRPEVGYVIQQLQQSL